MTTTVLSPESVIEIVKSIGPDDPLSIARDIEQAVLQSPEVQALRKDAERYRWLTKRAFVGEWATPDGYEYRVDGADRKVPNIEDVHVAIDAAMEKQL